MEAQAPRQIGIVSGASESSKRESSKTDGSSDKRVQTVHNSQQQRYSYTYILPGTAAVRRTTHSLPYHQYSTRRGTVTGCVVAEIVNYNYDINTTRYTRYEFLVVRLLAANDTAGD